MANIIDDTYFEGEILVAGKTSSETVKYLCNFIKKYEPDFLRQALGVSFYSLFNTGLQTDPVSDRWNNLLNGCDYANQQGQKYIWVGFKDKSMNCIADYVYGFYRVNQMSNTTPAAETKPKTENSIVVKPDQKMIAAWEEMVQIVRGNPTIPDDEETGYLWHFLLYGWDIANSRLIYPEFNLRIKGWVSLNSTNPFGL